MWVVGMILGNHDKWVCVADIIEKILFDVYIETRILSSDVIALYGKIFNGKWKTHLTKLALNHGVVKKN